MKKFLKIIFLILLIFCTLILTYFFIGKTSVAKNINWGIVFSQKHSQLLGLDWKENYLAILDDLGTRNLKIITHWDLLEPENGEYKFDDLDWMIKEAEKRNAKIILVIGMKTGRWPECHIPNWANYSIGNVEFEVKEEEFFKYLEIMVNRYKNNSAIWAWQVENEPFFPFGVCPEITKDFLRREIYLVKSLDSHRLIIFGDSGEFSFWINAAKLGDIVSATLHRRVYFKEIRRYITYPFPAIYYWRKAKLINMIFNKKVIIGELQAEPWCKSLIYNCDLKEQEITMNLEKFKENVKFAKETGLDTFYFWGGEWWYWMREKEKKPEIWEEAKKIFQQ